MQHCKSTLLQSKFFLKKADTSSRLITFNLNWYKLFCAFLSRETKQDLNQNKILQKRCKPMVQGKEPQKNPVLPESEPNYLWFIRNIWLLLWCLLLVPCCIKGESLQAAEASTNKSPRAPGPGLALCRFSPDSQKGSISPPSTCQGAQFNLGGPLPQVGQCPRQTPEGLHGQGQPREFVCVHGPLFFSFY